MRQILHLFNFADIIRGMDFRPEYRKLTVLRSLVQPHVRFIAMTATASLNTKSTILKYLHMSKAVVVEESPDKANIFLCVMPQVSKQNLIKTLAKGVMRLGTKYPKTLVFCRR